MVDFKEKIYFASKANNLLGIRFEEDSVTWGRDVFNQELCAYLPSNGYYRNSNQQPVLPHAVGCQNPTSVNQYELFLQEWIK